MSYWYTQYPYTFAGDTPYYVPFAVRFEQEMSEEYAEILHYLYDDPDASLDYRSFAIKKTSGTAELNYFLTYDISYSSGNAIIDSTMVVASTAPFSFKFSDAVKYPDDPINYDLFATEYSSDSSYTYENNTIYYKVLTLQTSFNDTALGYYNVANACSEFSTAQQTVINNNAQYFAWLTEYDNIYINDPYNRPPDYGDDEQRGGDGDWDTSSDTVVDPALPAGLWGQGFVSVYCPTTAELQTFANKIWDQSIRSDLNDIFPNGITSGIVDCFTLPVQPDTTTSGTITMGDIAIPGTSAAILANRFKEENFGSINLGEHFGGFPDYLCTKIAIYLPYIGWEQIAPEMVLRCSLSLKYKIDCLTGDFVAVLTTNRDDKFKFDGVSYTFQGNCASRIPITAQTGAGTSDYISAAISGIGAIAGSFVSGNPIPAVMGAANTINSMMSMNDKHTFALKGGFSGSKGQLTSQRPYLVINRPIMENNKNNNYFNLCGVPSNDYAQVSSCSGFTKALEVELQDSNFAGATEKEKSKITDLLKRGIYI